MLPNLQVGDRTNQHMFGVVRIDHAHDRVLAIFARIDQRDHFPAYAVLQGRFCGLAKRQLALLIRGHGVPGRSSCRQ